MAVSPCFVDESGTFSAPQSSQPVFCVGALIVPDPSELTERLYRRYFSFISERKARRRRLVQEAQAHGNLLTLAQHNLLMESTRHHEYKFAEIKQHNVEGYIDLLNIYFDFPTPIFHALIVDRQEFDFDRFGGNDRAAYQWCVTHLLRRRLDRDVFVILDLQLQPNEERLYLEEAICQAPYVQGCLRATSDTMVLLQVCDLFLGCLSFDWRDSRKLLNDSPRAAAQRRIVTFLKQRLRMRADDHFLRAGGARWRGWQHPSRFTVWAGEKQS